VQQIHLIPTSLFQQPFLYLNILCCHLSDLVVMSSVVELPNLDDLNSEQWEKLAKQAAIMQQLGLN